jgi:hypothetical protein
MAIRLLHLLLTQIERILEINSRIVLTKGVVEAARETLVIGQVQSKDRGSKSLNGRSYAKQRAAIFEADGRRKGKGTRALEGR